MVEIINKLEKLGWREISHGLEKSFTDVEVEISKDFGITIKEFDYQAYEYYAPEVSLEELKLITEYVDKLKEGF